MKYLTADFIAPFVCISALVTSLSLFYFDINRKADAGNKEKVGIITFRQAVAQRQYSEQVVWEEIEVNTPVYNNDSIRTAEKSDAHIKLNDGTLIKLSPNSLIRLAFSKDAFDIEFKQGSVSAKREAGSKELSIKSKDTVIKIGDADLSLSQDRTSGLSVLVNKGSASISRGDEKTELRENQEANLSKSRVDVHEVTLRLVSPERDRYILSRTKNSSVNFSWENLIEGFDVFLEVSNSGDFGRPILRKKVEQNGSSASLDWGNYYWRLSAVERKSRKVNSSEIRRLVIVNDSPAGLISPRNNSTASYRSDRPVIDFRWTESEYASLYTLSVASDPEMQNIIRSINLKSNTLSVAELAKGNYYWSVSTTARLGGDEHLTTSGIFRFVIEQNTNVDPPQLMFPADNYKINQLALSRKSLIFSWNKNPDIAVSRFIVAKDSNFSDIVHSEDSGYNYSRLQKELPEGIYFWRITGFLKESTVPILSPVWRFSVAKMDNLNLIGPVNGGIFVIDNSGGVPKIIFSWDKSGLVGKYRIIISNNDTFTSIYKQLDVSGLTTEAYNLDPGIYFWKVEFYDDENIMMMKSGVRSIVMLDRFGPLEIVEPGPNEVVDMSRKNQISLKWKKINGADEYSVNLYQVKDGKNYSISETSTGDSSYVFDNLKKLDEGTFLWTVQAIDNNKDTNLNANSVLRRSPVAKALFKIKLGESVSEDIKKLKAPDIIIMQ